MLISGKLKTDLEWLSRMFSNLFQPGKLLFELNFMKYDQIKHKGYWLAEWTEAEVRSPLVFCPSEIPLGDFWTLGAQSKNHSLQSEQRVDQGRMPSLPSVIQCSELIQDNGKSKHCFFSFFFLEIIFSFKWIVLVSKRNSDLLIQVFVCLL